MKTKTPYIEIDGSHGEGGGQIIRTSLALSMVTGQPMHITNIRAKRKKPGLLRQHLTALNAAAQICAARIEGSEMGATEIYFDPQAVQPGDYTFKVGTAGSATLVLQTVLPALMLAKDPSIVAIEGGTHNPFAPPYPFIENVFTPLARRMGFKIETRLERYGFYPAGGGRIVATVEPADRLEPLHLQERFQPLEIKATALLCRIPSEVGERELNELQRLLDIPAENLALEKTRNSPGPGNALMCSVSDGNIVELFTGFGERGVSAEQVAKRVAGAVRQHIDSGAPVGRHLADQLMVPMALVGEGSFRTGKPSMHALTNIEVIKKFCNINAGFTRESEQCWLFELTQGEEA